MHIKSNTCEYIKFPEFVISLSKKYDKSVDYSKFIITKESVYSAELPYHINRWINVLHKLLKNKTNTTCLDMTANIGGFSINIAKNYPQIKITALELDKCTYDALNQNIVNFGLERQINTVNIDCIKYIDDINLKYDFVYLDPPWGGHDYKYKESLELYLSNIKVEDVIKDIFNKKITKIVFLKAPINYYHDFKYKTDIYNFYKLDNKTVSYKVYKLEV